MKITKKQLKKIIKEELNKVLNETTPDQLEREGINQEFIQRRDDLRSRFVNYAEEFRDQGGCWYFWDPRAGCGPDTQETVDHMDQLIKFKEEFVAFEKWAVENNINPKLMRKLEKGYEPAFDHLMSRKLGKALERRDAVAEKIAAMADDPERFQQFGDWDVEIQREP